MTAWQSEMDQQYLTFSRLFEFYTTTPIIAEEYHYFGGPIPPRMLDVFRKFGSGDLDLADAAISRLADLNMQLGREYERLIGDAVDHLDDWEGDAATQARSWLRAMSSALGRQRELLEAMIMVHKAQRAVIEKFRADVLKLIDATNRGLQTASDNAEKFNLAVVSAVMGVVGALTAGTGIGLVVAVGAAMISGAASVKSASIDSSSHAQAIVSLVVSGEDLIKAAQEEMAKVEIGFREITKYLTGAELKYVRPDRPLVVTDTGFQPDGFHPQDGYTPQMRDKLPKTDVLPEPPRDADRDSDHGPWGTDEDVYPEQLRSTT